VSSLTPNEISSNSHADALIVLEASSASSGRMAGNPEVIHLGEKRAMRRSAEEMSQFGWLLSNGGNWS